MVKFRRTTSGEKWLPWGFFIISQLPNLCVCISPPLSYYVSSLLSLFLWRTTDRTCTFLGLYILPTMLSCTLDNKWLVNGWMNEYQLSLLELCLNCLDNLVFQSSVHILLRRCLLMSTDLGQCFDIMGLEHKFFLELWL